VCCVRNGRDLAERSGRAEQRCVQIVEADHVLGGDRVTVVDGIHPRKDTERGAARQQTQSMTWRNGLRTPGSVRDVDDVSRDHVFLATKHHFDPAINRGLPRGLERAWLQLVPHEHGDNLLFQPLAVLAAKAAPDPDNVAEATAFDERLPRQIGRHLHDRFAEAHSARRWRS
jgi:hypothetical protein